MSELIEAWEMSHETNLFLLGAIPPSHLKDRYGARTRTVASQFAHMHNVRLRWLTHAAPGLVAKLERFPKGAQPTKTALKKALTGSAKAVARFLEECVEAGKVKNWKGSPATFLGYLIAHEAHHRGLAMVAMRLSDHKLPNEVVYGLWDWGKKRSLRG